jgi:hypothetical protein
MTQGSQNLSLCAFKSHILQTSLIGHITCETCASEVTNRLNTRFLIKKASRATAPEVIWTKVFFSRPRFWKDLRKQFSQPPPKNTDTVQTNLVALEFDVRCYVNTLRILESSCPKVWSGDKVSRAQLPVFFCFSLKTCNFLLCCLCDSNSKPLISGVTLEGS